MKKATKAKKVLKSFKVKKTEFFYRGLGNRFSFGRKMPKNAIVWLVPPYMGWFAFKKREWYGDYVRFEKGIKFTSSIKKETIEILIDQMLDSKVTELTSGSARQSFWVSSKN